MPIDIHFSRNTLRKRKSHPQDKNRRRRRWGEAKVAAISSCPLWLHTKEWFNLRSYENLICVCVWTNIQIVRGHDSSEILSRGADIQFSLNVINFPFNFCFEKFPSKGWTSCKLFFLSRASSYIKHIFCGCSKRKLLLRNCGSNISRKMIGMKNEKKIFQG